MPLRELRCEHCQGLVEVFLQASDPEPQRCGHRCVLPPNGTDPERGFGALRRVVSAPGGPVRGFVARDVPTVADATRAGFTAFRNDGQGGLKKAR